MMKGMNRLKKYLGVWKNKENRNVIPFHLWTLFILVIKQQ